MDIPARTIATGFAFPECPRWHEGDLWFSDQNLATVFRLSSDGQVRESFEVPGRSSGLGWLPDGDLVVVSMRERRLYRRHNGALTAYASLGELHHAQSNDMVIDRHGRAYVGAVGFDYEAGESYRPTAIAVVGPTGAVSLGAADIPCPNGLAITADGKTLIAAESFANRLSAFDIGQDGALSNYRVFADLGEHLPDGICLDAAGAVWVACCYKNVVLRVAEGGAILDRVPIDNGQAYACMLGGADGKDLYICCALGQEADQNLALRQGRIDLARAPAPHAGLP